MTTHDERSTRCTVCRHPDRPEIEAALLQGSSQRAVARTFGLSATAAGDHVRNGHISQATRQVVAAVEHVASSEVMGQAIGLFERALAILTRAEAGSDPEVALAAIRESRQLLGTLVTVGQLREREEAAEREAAIEAAPDLDAEIRAWVDRTQGRKAEQRRDDERMFAAPPELMPAPADQA